MTLKELAIGKSAVIRTVGASGALRQHFLDMGMIPGAEVTVVKFAPIFASVSMSVFPLLILYMALNKKLMEGMTAGAVKG